MLSDEGPTSAGASGRMVAGTDRGMDALMDRGGPGLLEQAFLLGALAMVLLVAVALRRPSLQSVPPVTDESAEVLYALDIAVAGDRPLVHTDSYNGPLWPYLMAGTFSSLGVSKWIPRNVSFVFGLAAVVATFALGYVVALSWGQPWSAVAAAVAGLVQATSFTSVLVNSRVAWSNSTTPFWTATATTLLLLAGLSVWAHERRRQPSGTTFHGADTRLSAAGTVFRGPGTRLAGFLSDSRGVLLLHALAGASCGLALQTHPSVIVYLLGLAGWYGVAVWRAAPTNLGRLLAPATAFGAALLAYSPVIVYNLQTGFDTFDQAAASRNVAETPGPMAYLAHLGALVDQLGRALGGGFDPFGVDANWIWPSRLALAIALFALVASARVAFANGAADGFGGFGGLGGRGHPAGPGGSPSIPERRLPSLPLLVAAACVIGLPAVNQNWSGFLEARYLSFLTPLIGASAGLLTAVALRSVWRKPILTDHEGMPALDQSTRVLALAWLLALLVLLLMPAARALWFVGASRAAALDNRELLALVEQSELSGDVRQVVVEDSLEERDWPFRGDPLRAIEYYLTLQGSPYEVTDRAKINHYLSEARPLLVYATAETAHALATDWILNPIGEGPGGGWGLYESSGASSR